MSLIVVGMCYVYEIRTYTLTKCVLFTFSFCCYILCSSCIWLLLGFTDYLIVGIEHPLYVYDSGTPHLPKTRTTVPILTIIPTSMSNHRVKSVRNCGVWRVEVTKVTIWHYCGVIGSLQLMYSYFSVLIQIRQEDRFGVLIMGTFEWF